MEKQFAINPKFLKVASVLLLFIGITSNAQQVKTMVFDSFHGQNPQNAKTFQGLLPAKTKANITLSQTTINDSVLMDKHALILFSPTKPFTATEKDVIVKYLNHGGSLLLIFDEERRMKLNEVGVNDLVKPFGIEFTDDAPVRHNCGAIAEKSTVCENRRELPYSGGRSIVGGEVISRVYDDGNYIHCAYKTNAKGKIILMSDGMAGLLLGRKDGERFSGTGPSDSKYWGGDSEIFMKEILTFLAK